MYIRDLIRESNHIEEVWDEEEDQRSFETWKFLVKNFDWISIPTVLLTHENIMGNLDPRIAGQFRNCNVQVRDYLAPHWQHVGFLMDEWVLTVASKSPKQAHIDFERIHPFEDGNGRTGRMLMWFHEFLTKRDLTVITYDNRFEYYDWFSKDVLVD